MKTHLIRGLGLAMVMATAALTIDAQRTRPEVGGQGPTPSDYCVGLGANCWFGSSGDCYAVCTAPRSATCTAGGCLLGFPNPPTCSCS